MATEPNKRTVAKYPLRLMPSVRESAEAFSQKEGVSLNQFINVAVAQRIERLRHEDWAKGRKKPTPELAAEALALLDRVGDHPADPGDELPDGYVPIRDRR